MSNLWCLVEHPGSGGLTVGLLPLGGIWVLRGSSMWRIRAIFALLALTACAHAPSPPTMVWVRADGQRIADNPMLAQQRESDKTICQDDAQPDLASTTPVGTNQPVEQQQSTAEMDAIKGCMAQRGYLLVPADQAEAVREHQLTATEAQRQPAAVTTPRHAARKPKPKPEPKLQPPQQSPEPPVPFQPEQPQFQQPLSPQQPSPK